MALAVNGELELQRNFVNAQIDMFNEALNGGKRIKIIYTKMQGHRYPPQGTTKITYEIY
jgi:hypothetical protein